MKKAKSSNFVLSFCGFAISVVFGLCFVLVFFQIIIKTVSAKTCCNEVSDVLQPYK